MRPPGWKNADGETLEDLAPDEIRERLGGHSQKKFSATSLGRFLANREGRFMGGRALRSRLENNSKVWMVADGSTQGVRGLGG